MRLAIVNESWTAGATRCARDLERHLASRHEVRYYPRGAAETPAGLLADLAAYQPDVVHCHSYYGDLPYRFLATLSRRYPTCFTPHDPRPLGTLDPVCWQCPSARWCLRCPLHGRVRRYSVLFNRYFWQRLGKRLVHYAAAKSLTLVTPSDWLRQRLARMELSRFTIHHVPNGIDLARFRPIPDARTRLGLSEQVPVLLYVAHSGPGWYMHERKGLRFLADAFVRQIIPAHPDAMLVVVGESLVPNHPNVRPAGFVAQENLPAYYAAADVFVIPTLADNLPYTVSESLACGTPVVGSRIGGIPEQVEEGVTGQLTPPRDAAALGRALLDLLADRAKLPQIRQACRARAEQLFAMETFVCRYEEIYRQAISRS